MPTMTASCFEIEITDHVAHLRLNRPEKRNSMIPAFWSELPDAVRAIDARGDARAIVISSTGPHFTAGLDIEAFLGSGASLPGTGVAPAAKGADFYGRVAAMQDTFSALEQCRVPVLAAIQGGCIGGGVDLATACCIRNVSRDAFFTIFETNIGMTADVGTFPRIAKLLPEGIVRALAYTGRRMHADEAQRLGFANRVFDDHDGVVAGTLELAAEIASKAPLAVYGCKRMVTYARDHSTADALDYVRIWNASFLSPDEMREAMTANAEKRAGDFADLPPLDKA